MQHGDLDITKVLKIQRDSKSDVKKPNSKSVKFCPTGQTGIAHRSDRLNLSQNKFDPLNVSGPFTRFQRHLPDMFGLGPNKSDEQFDRWNLSSTGQV
jgi:hypothetical protein